MKVQFAIVSILLACAGSSFAQSDRLTETEKQEMKTAQVQRNERLKLRCEKLTAALRSLNLPNLDSIVIIDQIECFRNAGPDSLGWCAFRVEYGKNYVLTGQAGDQFFNAMTRGTATEEYYQEKFGMGLIGDTACNAIGK